MFILLSIAMDTDMEHGYGKRTWNTDMGTHMDTDMGKGMDKDIDTDMTRN